MRARRRRLRLWSEGDSEEGFREVSRLPLNASADFETIRLAGSGGNAEWWTDYGGLIIRQPGDLNGSGTDVRFGIETVNGNGLLMQTRPGALHSAGLLADNSEMVRAAAGGAWLGMFRTAPAVAEKQDGDVVTFWYDAGAGELVFRVVLVDGAEKEARIALT